MPRHVLIGDEERTELLELLGQAKNPELEAWLQKLQDDFEVSPEDEALIAKAREEYVHDDEIEIDDNAVVSCGEDGAFVMAWVFIRYPDEEIECVECTKPVLRSESMSTPCGSIHEDCLSAHAQDCDICRSEFDL
jgi:hypothetical protein